MSDQVSWSVELAIRPGQAESFKALTRAMVEATRREPGALSYQRFVSDDGRIVHACERYADSAAALGHLCIFARDFAEPFSRMAERIRFTVYGTPSAELRQMLDRFGAVYCRPFGDLGYWP